MGSARKLFFHCGEGAGYWVLSVGVDMFTSDRLKLYNVDLKVLIGRIDTDE